MKISQVGKDIVCHNPDSFVLPHIFDCGQCFRWEENADNSYTGVAMDRALTISCKGQDIIFHSTTLEDFHNIWHNYFDMSTNYADIKNTLSNDPVLGNAIGYGQGIRILRQDLWECAVSFIISASNNIPRIKKIINSLCQNFGEKISYMNKDYYTFPSPQKIHSLSLEDLGVIKAGFRDKYIKACAEKFVSGEISQETLAPLSTALAKKELMSIHGVGNKVSDCILLFGLHRTESFPIDVWIKRIVEYCYFEKEQTIDKITEFSKEKFGELGGYAQQYLFFYARENKIGL